MRTKTLTVIWGLEGRPCPMARKIRRIDKRTGRDLTMVYDEPVVVPNTLYYRRRIRVGDLAIVKTPPPEAEPPKRGARVKKVRVPATPGERKDD